MVAKQLDSAPSIAAFYAGRSVFVTGATGFLGKVLVEKLLRSCPDIHEIFLLMRTKKTSTIDDRLHKMISLPIFDKLRETNPEAFKKLIPVTGDTQEEGLGLPPLERKIITEKVSIIFHAAASVRFDDNLKAAVFTNTRSTRDICILAGSMKKLVALVHISTTYAHADKPEVEEIVYDFDVDWKKTIKIAENVDNHTLNVLTAKYLGNMPNTYTFTKRLAEKVISDYSKVLPCVICRPSIVVSTLNDPFPGWIDNMNGPVGMMVGGGKGVLRVMYGNPKARGDYIPVDIVIKSIIIASWERGLRTVTQDPRVFVYNCAVNNIYSWPLKKMSDMALIIHEDFPLENCVWAPSVMHTQSRVLHFILTILFHIIPALVIDLILKLSGKRTGLLRIQRKIYISNTFLSFFICNEWVFNNDRILKIMQQLSPENKESFYCDTLHVNLIAFLRDGIIGAKKYLLHEDTRDMTKAKAQYKRMYWIDLAVKVWMLIVVGWIISKSNIFSSILDIVA